MRELTREEKAAIRSLVTKWCANYDREMGCLPLDCECYMLGKCWTGAYCRYFREAVMLENGRGFALGEHPRASSPFVTWACYDDEHGARQYEWGHYGSDRAALEQDLLERVESYQQQFSVKVAHIEAPGLYKYYSTQRPVDIGTFPKPAGNEPDEIENYDKRVPVEGGAFLAWGHLTYTKPLTEKQAADYELRPAPEVSGLLREGRPRPIAEQMKEAARLAGGRQAPAAPKRNAPDRGDR